MVSSTKLCKINCLILRDRLGFLTHQLIHCIANIGFNEIVWHQQASLLGGRPLLLVARTLLGAPGLSTRNKKLLVTQGIATRAWRPSLLFGLLLHRFGQRKHRRPCRGSKHRRLLEHHGCHSRRKSPSPERSVSQLELLDSFGAQEHGEKQDMEPYEPV